MYFLIYGPWMSSAKKLPKLAFIVPIPMIWHFKLIHYPDLMRQSMAFGVKSIPGFIRHHAIPPLSSSIASARHDQVEKFVGLFRIEASQFPDGIQGGCPVAGKG